MATEKASKDKISVEERLKSLYELQTILSEIDRIKQIRGELPIEVKDLEDQIEGLKTRIANYETTIAELKQKRANESQKINEAHALINRYEEQLNNISNNREFDLLQKEIVFQNLEIQSAENNIKNDEKSIELKNKDIEATKTTLGEKEHLLEEKRNELNDIVSETRQDEERLREKALALEPLIDPRTLSAFKRIRRNARNGLGIVYITRNACGGCFNRIPPQKQLEIKMRKKIIVCEYCGRILVDPELAGVSDQPEA